MKNLGQLMKQAQQMQERMAEMQARLGEATVEGSAGAGLVTVTLNGKGDMTALRVDPAVAGPDDREMLEDLIVAAHADARTKVEARMQEEMQRLTGGLPLPPGFKLPFG